MLSLNDVDSFGGTAAEDDDIEKFFIRTRDFKLLYDQKRHIVTGRKGAGKTALYLAIDSQARKEGRLVRALSFSEYPWATHSKYASNDTTNIERYVETWRFFILIQAFMAVIDAPTRPRGRNIDRSIGEVEKFLTENYGSTFFDFKKVFPSGGLQFSDSSFGIGSGGVSSSIKATKSTHGLGESLSRLNEWLEFHALQLRENFPVTYILFDELDLGYNPADPNYRHRIAGLLIATRRFVKWSRANRLAINPIVFIRSDIFDGLHFGDLNKIHEANRVDLKWNDKLTYTGSSLKELIDWRIKESLDLPEGADNPWGAAFDSQLTRGTQHKFQHITFRTFLRPRDVIKFCNLALQQAQDRCEGESSLLITNDDLKAARPAYSEYFVRELDDEIAEADENWRDCLEILRNVGSARFTHKDFEEALRKAQSRIEIHYSAEEALRLLYRYSIIGFEGIRTSGHGLTDHFRYLNDSVNFDPAARSFLVHRALKEALDLTET